MGATGRSDPIACFKCPIHAPSASLPYIGHPERIVIMCFIRGAFRNTWTFTTPVPSAEHRFERPINTMLSPRKMGEWLLERSIARDQ
ncbi:hypothetical protein TNIN_134441 [Trichonephila inaurata madagascariensis]|uniref:Uncharacterized protein n=1 Tax=Trichonephila inaurata madagascariensis TaxID=2747483 RepID=A0A8X6JE02_9ARAC|nr:hypothetical protein TNIN_134441 [Trichonephila inaurata madagascariensis]